MIDKGHCKKVFSQSTNLGFRKKEIYRISSKNGSIGGSTSACGSSDQSSMLMCGSMVTLLIVSNVAGLVTLEIKFVQYGLRS